MSAKIGLKKWLRRISLALVIFALLSVTPYFAVRAFVELVRAFDDRSASPQEALSSLTIYPHGGFTTLIPEGVDYEIMQRQVLRYASPSGILYGLGWQDEDGESCFATAFVERMTDTFGGWTGRWRFWPLQHARLYRLGQRRRRISRLFRRQRSQRRRCVGQSHLAQQRSDLCPADQRRVYVCA